MIVLLISSSMMLEFSASGQLTKTGTEVLNSSTTATPLTSEISYGDLNQEQYAWPQPCYDEGFSNSQPGPGPTVGNIQFKIATAANSAVVLFGGYAYVATGNRVYRYDAQTGALSYISNDTGGPSITGDNGIAQLDGTYFLTMGTSGMSVRRITDGSVVWNFTDPNAARTPGSGAYFGGRYSTSMKMWFNTGDDPVFLGKAYVLAINLTDPSVKQTQPAWYYYPDQSLETLCSGDGKVFLGTTEGDVIALNATGNVVWQTAILGGIPQQAANYYNGNLYLSAVTWYLTSLNGTTGEINWQTSKGVRAFTAYCGAVGGGLIYMATDDIPVGTMGAWNLETGQRVWYNTGYYNIHYDTLAYAGNGYVYGVKCDAAAGRVTSTQVSPGYGFSCWDAYTGQEIWRIDGIQFTAPTIAYGNLYGVYNGFLYCIGSKPADWSMGLIGNIAQPRVSAGYGPNDISKVTWQFQTGGDTFSSPAIVNGLVYFGSGDKNLYCLNAYTGQKVWNFTTGFYLRSSPAVDNGLVFTGADDGYFYGINALTGQQVWKTSAGGFFPNYLTTNEGHPSSSPIVYGGYIYCGSKDNNLYCLTEQGTVQWTFRTGGPIFGSPSYSNGAIYIASSDGYLYAVSATSGTLVWKSSFTLNGDVGIVNYCQYYNIADPTVANGIVYIGGGVQYGGALFNNAYYLSKNLSVPLGANGGGIRMFAFNAATGASIWNVSRAGNTQPAYYPAVLNGQIYAPEMFEVTAMNATYPLNGTAVTPDFVYTNRVNGNRTWASWLGYQIQGSVAYAGANGIIYAGSDLGTLYAMRASDGMVVSQYTLGANIPTAPSLWNGMLFVGSTDGKMYCFDSSRQVSTNLFATTSKGASMWNNQTNAFVGQLTSNPTVDAFDYTSNTYVQQPMQYTPALPNQTVTIVLVQPDGSNMLLNTTTALDGSFSLSINPTQVGTYNWLAEYTGMRIPGSIYSPSNTQYTEFSVTAAPIEATPTPIVTPSPTPVATETPTATPEVTTSSTTGPGGISATYLYAIVAVIVIVIVAVAAYMLLVRKKKPA